jgi:hypothetical protein
MNDRWARRLAGMLWWGVLLYLVLLAVRGPLLGALRRTESAADVEGVLGVAAVLLGIVLLVVVFWLASYLGRWLWATLGEAPRPAAGAPPPVASPAATRARFAFPHPVTVAAGAWLVLATLVSLALLILVMVMPPWLAARLGDLGRNSLEDVLVTMFAGGIGGSVSAILAYLRHAAEAGDFEREYLPWYFARPLLGLLLGLITFFLVKGGLLMTLPRTEGADFNNYGLAAIGSLVGLFSKNAVEKLREVFDVVFASRAQVRREVEQELDGDAAGGGGAPQAGTRPDT